MRVKLFGAAIVVAAATFAPALGSGVSSVALPVRQVVFGAPLPLEPLPDDPAPSRDAPVPTRDQVVAVLTKLTDSNIPCQNKTDLVTPGFSPAECATISDRLNQMTARRDVPFNFVVTDIQPAPNNFAGATVAVPSSWPPASTPPGPVVLVNRGGHWLITHDTAVVLLDALWDNETRRPGFFDDYR